MSRSKFLSSVAGLVVLFGCGGGGGGESGGGGEGGEGSGNGTSFGGSTGDGFGAGSEGGGNVEPETCSDAAKLVYLVSVDYQLYSFDPNIPGTGAYKPIGQLNCPSAGSPQSMSVDRAGMAYVFYDSGELFKVSTANASCQPTNYVHPVQQGFNQLGMGFTADVPDSVQEILYVVSPAFGLATVDKSSYQVTQTGSLVGAAELTGGPDAKLFHFAAESAMLSEVNLGNNTLSPIHSFSNLVGTQAWAFSRYAGKFYMFTAPNAGTGTTTTEYDPVENTSIIRDGNIGFTVVGAGQSTCVPPPETPE